MSRRSGCNRKISAHFFWDRVADRGCSEQTRAPVDRESVKRELVVPRYGMGGAGSSCDDRAEDPECASANELRPTGFT
jgi:hypothetical protein